MPRWVFGFVVFAVAASVAAFADAGYSVAANEGRTGFTLIEDVGPPVQRIVSNGHDALASGPNPDYMTRKGIPFRVESGGYIAGSEVFLIIEHDDANIGVIEVNAAPAKAEPLAGRACLGTHAPRRAVFRIAPAPEAGARIEIIGVRSLTGIRLLPSLDPGLLESVQQETPTTPAAPPFQLKRPMQLVMSVGADAKTPEELPSAMDQMRVYCPIASALGFSGVESYVKWNFVEPEQGRFDWSYYDAVVAEAQGYGLRWFPLLIVGSAYALPPWFHDSPENLGFVCLEHNKGNNIQTIFSGHQRPHVERYLKAFGEHYGPMDALLGVRLGPSGNYGESQYPAGGNWGYGDEQEHIHIGWWAGDPYAAGHFQAYLRKRYASVAELNTAWEETYAAFEDIAPFIPQFAENPRKRKDFVDWYVDAMTGWCEDWAVWARQSMPDTSIYQSSGGWGFVESGTDFTDQTKSMAKVHGGIRATNETDSYAQNFFATRMMSSAARFYGVPFGSEPAGFGSARGVMARLYNILINNGQHLFYYYGNLLGNDQAVDKWLAHAPLLDQRDEPFIEVAALYPDTMGKLDDAVFRNLYAFTFNSQVAALRPKLDFDFCSERMVLDGALPRYKVLLLLWNQMIEKDPLNQIDAWVQEGGIVLVAQWRFNPITTVEGDSTVYDAWRKGQTGKGKVLFVPDDRVPPARLANALERELLALGTLDPQTVRMLKTDKPEEVYVSALKNGSFALLNYRDDKATVTVPGAAPVEMDPYTIAIVPSTRTEVDKP
ncbi:MAG: beta-galactosidase [Candidatus Hydrogenedentes bacterium]|nr:beta-galactosidase [Candidatus Hydrogenedentota bacterium]